MGRRFELGPDRVMRDSAPLANGRTNSSAPARAIAIAVILIVTLPREAFAHGEQLLVFPAATVVLILLAGLVWLAWRESRGHKVLLIGTVFVVHALLWFLPVTVAELARVAGRMFVALIALPVGAAAVVHILVRRGRHGGRNA